MEVNKIIHGDALEELKKLSDNSIDAVVTDPPYGIGFMGEEWDSFSSREYQEFCYQWGSECLRVLKPGGFLLAFSGCRTYHRMVVGLEDAGFIINDQIDWIFGEGFPKGLDLSKAIDKHFGRENEREVIDVGKRSNVKSLVTNLSKWDRPEEFEITAPATLEARQWEGWKAGKQALKPAHEPICVAQKPVEGNYVNNVLKWGCGGINVDGCRVSGEGYTNGGRNRTIAFNTNGLGETQERCDGSKGRFPANLIIDEFVAELLDEQSGESKSSVRISEDVDLKQNTFSLGRSGITPRGHDDSGGASRYFKVVKPFMYCPKAGSKERDDGLDEVEAVEKYTKGHGNLEEDEVTKRFRTEVKNDIPSLKPINLMRWLVRLVTPPKGVVLDPFAGSGTTGVACVVENFNYVLIEKQEKFAKNIIPKRIEYWGKERHQTDLPQHKELPDLNQASLDNWS